MQKTGILPMGRELALLFGSFTISIVSFAQKKSLELYMPCIQNLQPLFSKAFTEKYMKGETRAAENAGRYQWYTEF